MQSKDETHDLKFTVLFGDEVKQVYISRPNGAAGSFFVLIDHYYQGMFIKYKDRWEFRTNVTDLTADDIDGLRELLPGE